MNFREAFPLYRDKRGKLMPAVTWGKPETCRPSETFGPDETYGVPTGPRNGIFVVDLDRGHQPGVDGLASLAEAAAGRDIPDTYAVRSPRGGVHLYFKWNPEHPVGNRTGVLSGTDVRGAGGYVRAGAGYEVISDAPIADAPAWVYAITGRKGDEQPAVSAIAISPGDRRWSERIAKADAYITGQPPCIEGQGQSEQQVREMAVHLSRTLELPIDTSMQQLEPFFARCNPPGYVRDKMRRALVRAADGQLGGQILPGTFASDSALLVG